MRVIGPFVNRDNKASLTNVGVKKRKIGERGVIKIEKVPGTRLQKDWECIVFLKAV